jgi:formate hydrogenlyase subunit 6/NADH:ubiquinone oxidoreductase subunit I
MTRTILPFGPQHPVFPEPVEDCTLCGVCAAKCPSRCIEVDKKEGLWVQDPYACVTCGVCAELCPAGSLRHRALYRPPAQARALVRLQGKARQA